MKKVVLNIKTVSSSIILLLCLTTVSYGQVSATYNAAMKLYENGTYKEAAKEFDSLYNEFSFQLSDYELYNGACIYALNNEVKKALDILEYLATIANYTNLNHIVNDSDLDILHSEPQWEKIINQIKCNNLPVAEKAKKELLKAKKILEYDNGKLWGEQIWNDRILVLAADNSVFALTPFAGSIQDSSGLYYAKLPANTLSFTNTIQDYDNQQYAAVTEYSLSDNSATIIHELFHILQHKHRMLNGMPIDYLDKYDARQWLRLEFQALRNCLNSIIKNEDRRQIDDYLQDAIVFRKMRHTGYEEFLQRELELETLEGLADYTGHVLSTYPNKYERAIKELNGRESLNTYTRMSVYATGFAYGVIFDYLKINWKQGLDSVYNFEEIYEIKYLKHNLLLDEHLIEKAKERNNYPEIYLQETERKDIAERRVSALRRQLVEEPTLSATPIDMNFRRGYDANGTVMIDGAGMAYTTIVQATDVSGGKNFGSFTFSAINYPEKITGILETIDGTYIFPLPFRQEGNKIIGDTYEIVLNEGWVVKKKNDQGDFEIVKEEEK